MTVRRFEEVSVEEGLIQSYVHGNGRIGVLAELACEVQNDVVKTVARI